MLTAQLTQSQSSPWLAEKGVKAEQEADEAPKSVQWYQPSLKSIPASTVELFEKYVGLRGEQAIKEHIYRVRDKAWNVLPYPCIGLFRFLDFSIHLSPQYPEVIQRVQSGAVVLDLGCCFGQDLRKLAFDAGTSANLIGCDLEEAFLQLGYELFRDRATLKARFVPGNVFASNFLEEYRGKIDIVYLGSFLHLFNEGQQMSVVSQLRRLLRPGPGAMVFGRHLGADKGGPFRMESIGWDVYRHDHGTMARLFHDCADDGEQWDVTSSLSRYGSAAWDDDRRDWQGDETRQMMFTATRL